MAARGPETLRSGFRRCTSSKQTRRSFSYTCRRCKNGPLMIFPKTSSPELDTLLSTWRRNVFLPSHLSTQHTSLVYRRSLQHFLTGEEPITAKVAMSNMIRYRNPIKQTVTLEPLDHFDEPNTRRSLRELIALLKEKKDWDMLPFFLRELRLSGRKIPIAMVERLVRRAAETGFVGTLIEIFRHTDVAGLRIEDARVAMEVMLGIVRKATEAEWVEHDLERAAQNAETALRMMLETQHGPSDQAVSPGKEPQVVGVPLALVGARVVKYKNGRDEEGKVREYARRWVECFGEREIDVDRGSPAEGNVALTEWAPSWLGVSLALKILKKEPGLTDVLSGIQKKTLEPLIRKALDVAKEEGAKAEERRGVRLYNNLSSIL